MTDSLKDRVDGAMDKGMGEGKEALGKATGNEQAKGEGQLDQAQGEAKDGVADLKDKAGDLMDKLKGK